MGTGGIQEVLQEGQTGRPGDAKPLAAPCTASQQSGNGDGSGIGSGSGPSNSTSAEALIRSLFTTQRLVFCGTAAAVFLGLAALFHQLYGWQFIQASPACGIEPAPVQSEGHNVHLLATLPWSCQHQEVTILNSTASTGGVPVSRAASRPTPQLLAAVLPDIPGTGQAARWHHCCQQVGFNSHLGAGLWHSGRWSMALTVTSRCLRRLHHNRSEFRRDLLYHVQPGNGSAAGGGGGAGLALCCVPPGRMAAADAGLCGFQQGALMDASCGNSVHVIQQSWERNCCFPPVAMAMG